MRKKIALGIVAAAVAIPSLSAPAAAQYYGGYGSYSPADLNRDGRVDARENRIAAERQGNYYCGGYGGYGSYSQADLNRDGRVDRRENRIYQEQIRSGGYYGNSYGYNGGGYYPQSNAGQYSRYYNQQGYYSGPTWRGNDGRYYCRRSDGTTGTLVGGAAGALIGSQVAGRGDRTIGAILGGAIGAVIGREVERGNDRNRCY